MVSFPTNDSLRGPDGAILLCKKEIAPQLDAAVANTGHTALHTSRLAALAFALHAAAQPKFRAYGEQVLANSRALAASLAKRGVTLLCGGTETHLVLAAPAPGVDLTDVVHTLARIGLYVKPDRIPTMRAEFMLSVLRLSTLNPTTRGLTEGDMEIIAETLAHVLSGAVSEKQQEALRMNIGKLIMDKPLFSDKWMNLDAMAHADCPVSGEGIAVHTHAASERRNILKNLFQ